MIDAGPEISKRPPTDGSYNRCSRVDGNIRARPTGRSNADSDFSANANCHDAEASHHSYLHRRALDEIVCSMQFRRLARR
jgi:hypothetical protein